MPSKEAQALFGFTQPTRDEDSVAWLGAMAKDHLTAAALSDDGYIDQDFLTARRVAPRGWAVESARSRSEAVQKIVKPDTRG
jgi:hypothetical protein